MSAFPQIVWRPSPKDVVAEYAPRIALFRVLASLANVVVTANSPADMIPADQVLILRHAQAFADPGAGQVLQNVSINITQNAAVVCQLAAASNLTPVAAGQGSGLGWQGELVLTNTEALNAIAQFDLGGAANTCNLSLGGYFVPRGNWQR